MANGNSVNHWHSYGNWSVSTSGKTATVTLTVGMASESWGFSLSSGVTATATIDGTSGSASGGFSSGTGQSASRSLKTVSKSFARGHSAQGKSVSWKVVNASGYMNGTSSGSGTATIPALGSHTVKFDANGGSGGPGSTTKWEYENLAIPSTVPSRANYKFLGWSTSAAGTVAYEAGKTYSGTPDSNYTLYAVWKLMYVPPSFTGALALRTGDATATVENPTGNYAYASFTWKVDTTVYSSNALKSITCVYYRDGSTTATAVPLTGATSGTSGTVNAHFAADSGSAYRLVCTATDTQGGSTSVERSVAAANFPLEIAGRGKGIGLLHSAPAEGISLGGVTLTQANGVSGSYPMSTLKGVLDNARYVKWTVVYGSLDSNHLAYKVVNGICYISIDAGSVWGPSAANNAGTVLWNMPAALKPATVSVNAACYPKAGRSGVIGVNVSGGKLLIMNQSGSSTSYYSVDFCYPLS